MTYAWGKNKDGELSMGLTKDVDRPRAVKGVKGKNLVMVTSGGQHSAAVDNSGRLYVCGSYLHGKLGIEDLSSVSVLVFTQVTYLRDKVITQVACGDYHTLCLADDGSVYTWGGTLHKKLGKKGGGSVLNRPGLVSSLQTRSITFVDCGDFHSVALSSEGVLYSWGGGGTFFNRGQCGHGHTQDIETPTAIPAFKNKFVTQVSCGGYHTLALTDRDELFAFGSGLYGECGYGEFLNTSAPKLVKMPKVKNPKDNFEGRTVQISAGGHHSFVLTEQGYLYSFGFASHGQLGLRNTVNQSEPQLVRSLRNKQVRQVAAGWNHTLVLTHDGDVFSCGYGFFGQLGLGETESRTNFAHVGLFGARKVERIYAGGNHSWALLDPALPIRPNYEPPSPPLSESASPAISRSASPLRRVDALEVPRAKRPDFLLTVAYTDVTCCHRFVRFCLSEPKLAQGKARAEEFVHEMYMAETGVQYHRIQEDNDIISLTEDGSEVVSPGNGLSFTCLLVCDPSRNSPPVIGSNTSEEPLNSNVVMLPTQLSASSLQRNLSEWVRFFMQKLGGVIDGPAKFFELRPYGYFEEV
jgi:alpha-tubulin suppressor-like RCC1 family protein